ncbi:Cys-tRNA(Pro) deacylase [Anaerobacterium chartisolvens]|uniref:Cys-tRNA(Pro) deacylase n=1 Tax=Anaerobacterium chartisolvens TaxID=1297424 RepID=A0A369BHN0_9FIRM|nr:YbaK/EbsC family protein [Anaerobacterium chartisolvens]RCX20078.1 Cys-tRNA(Pro) deacylase [Anaerobacterium chartisolvens]
MNSDNKLRKSSQTVQEVLNKYGLELRVVEFDESTRTSQDAANTIGCELGQIAKSLIFRSKESKKPVCVIASGKNRVNEKKIAQYIGEKIEKADAAFVLEHTGFAIGGIPPVGHATEMSPLIDEDLMEYIDIWAAAGTPHAVFKLSSEDLLKITKGQIVSVK